MISRTAASSRALPAGANARAGHSTKASTSSAFSGSGANPVDGVMDRPYESRSHGANFCRNLARGISRRQGSCMRHVFAAGFVVVMVVVTHATAAAPLSARSPDGKKVAEVRARAAGGDGLWIDGRQVWPPAAESKRRATITARPT